MLKEKVKKLRDVPITKRHELVDREEELMKFQLLVDYYEGGIIGIAGERGIGKTSLFNVVNFPGKKKVLLRIVDRENKCAILSDILHGLRPHLPTDAVAALNGIIEDILPLLSLRAGPIEARFPKKTFREIIDELGDLMERYGKNWVIVLDEIDKEKKDDVLRIIDSLKDAFKNNQTTLLVALPHVFYEEMLRQSINATDTYNLDNVFDYIYLLRPMPDDAIETLIHDRLNNLIEPTATAAVVAYSRGNPRRCIRTLKEAGMLAVSLGEERVRREHVKAVIKKYIRMYLAERHIEQRELKALSMLLNGADAKTIAHELRVSIPTAYRIMKKLKEIGLWGPEQSEWARLVVEMMQI